MKKISRKEHWLCIQILILLILPPHHTTGVSEVNYDEGSYDDEDFLTKLTSINHEEFDLCSIFGYTYDGQPFFREQSQDLDQCVLLCGMKYCDSLSYNQLTEICLLKNHNRESVLVKADDDVTTLKVGCLLGEEAIDMVDVSLGASGYANNDVLGTSSSSLKYYQTFYNPYIAKSLGMDTISKEMKRKCFVKNKSWRNHQTFAILRDMTVDQCIEKCKSSNCVSITYFPSAKVCCPKNLRGKDDPTPYPAHSSNTMEQISARMDCLSPGSEPSRSDYENKCIMKNKIFRYDKVFLTLRNQNSIQDCINSCKQKSCYSFTYIKAPKMCFLKKESGIKDNTAVPTRSQSMEQYSARMSCLESSPSKPSVTPNPYYDRKRDYNRQNSNSHQHKMITPQIKAKCFMKNVIYNGGTMGTKKEVTVQQCYNMCCDQKCYMFIYFVNMQMCMLKSSSVSKVATRAGSRSSTIYSVKRSCVMEAESMPDNEERPINEDSGGGKYGGLKQKCLVHDKLYPSGYMGYDSLRSIDACIDTCARKKCKAFTFVEERAFCILKGSDASSKAVSVNAGYKYKVVSGLLSCFLPNKDLMVSLYDSLEELGGQLDTPS